MSMMIDVRNGDGRVSFPEMVSLLDAPVCGLRSDWDWAAMMEHGLRGRGLRSDWQRFDQICVMKTAVVRSV